MIPRPLAKRRSATLPMREFTRGEPACGMGNEGVGAGRRGEFAVLLEDGPYEG